MSDKISHLLNSNNNNSNSISYVDMTVITNTTNNNSNSSNSSNSSNRSSNNAHTSNNNSLYMYHTSLKAMMKKEYQGKTMSSILLLRFYLLSFRSLLRAISIIIIRLVNEVGKLLLQEVDFINWFAPYAKPLAPFIQLLRSS